VQLTDVESGAHLWADRFDTDRANLAAAQDEITGRIAATLNVELVRDATRRIDQEKAADPNARDLVMRGRAFRFRPASEANRLDALLNFERALEIDPRSLDARIGVASTLVANLADGWSNSPEQDIARAEQLLIDVLETGLYSAWAHVVIGMLRRVQNRLDEAKMECESAIALDRNDAGALFQLGLTLMFLGRPEAATSYIEKALRLNPHDPNAANRLLGIGCVSSLFGRYRSGTRPDQQGSRRKSPALVFSSRPCGSAGPQGRPRRGANRSGNGNRAHA
jgi:tetratricopeptide (TPR) repeat protein